MISIERFRKIVQKMETLEHYEEAEYTCLGEVGLYNLPEGGEFSVLRFDGWSVRLVGGKFTYIDRADSTVSVFDFDIDSWLSEVEAEVEKHLPNNILIVNGKKYKLVEEGK